MLPDPLYDVADVLALAADLGYLLADPDRFPADGARR
jgi:hypothetical protein